MSRQRSSAVAALVRHYRVFAGLILLLGAFNLTFRLGHEFVVEWDESLYGLSAWEMLQNHQWIGTTFRGSLDYYNTKPPLNIWLISIAFKIFGTNLIALRLPSILSAWVTIAVLQEWTRRAMGPVNGLFAGLILATSFGFLYDHAARNANTDALFALLVLLTVVTLWGAEEHPWRLLWLGPVMAGAFLLRGMGVLMPLAIACLVETARRLKPLRRHGLPLAAALVMFAVPVGVWAWTRWQLDRWQFLGPLVTYDLLARSFHVIEGHRGSVFYHLNVLQKNQFDWLSMGVTAWALFPCPPPQLRRVWSIWHQDTGTRLVIGAWVGVTLLVPTLIRTKLSWYLNPFYPALAVGLAWLIARGLEQEGIEHRTKQRVLLVVIVAALVVAETRLLWYSTHRRSLATSTQGLLLAERQQLRGHRIFRSHWDNGELFVLAALTGSEAREAQNVDEFADQSVPGDYWLSRTEVPDDVFRLVRTQGKQRLYQRTR